MNEPDLKKLRLVIADNLQVTHAEITTRASFSKDLGADSLDVVELFMDIENQFNIEIPDEAIEQLHCLQDIIDYIDSCMNTPESG